MKLRWDHPLRRRGAPSLARHLVQGLVQTCALELVAQPPVRDLFFSRRPLVFAAWHCHLLGTLVYYRRHQAHLPPLVLMISPSRDGEFLADVARGLGFAVCFGSRRKGGMQALRCMANHVLQGHSCGIIADGSRGPARVAQLGVLYLSRITRAPLLPAAVAIRRKVTFPTWDRFELPLPFTRLALLLAEPLKVDSANRGPLLEASRLELEARLNRLCHQGQAWFPD